MKRNKKNQNKGIHLDGKTNQYVRKNESPEQLPASTQHPLGNAKEIDKNISAQEDHQNHKIRQKGVRKLW